MRQFKTLHGRAATLVLLAALAGHGITPAYAQSSNASVDLATAVITNTAVLGSTADQTFEAGNATKGGQTSLAMKTAVVTNTAVLGSKASQTTRLANADGSGSKADVKIDTLVQTNTAVLGSKANQTLEAGTAANGAQAKVNMKTLVMTNTCRSRLEVEPDGARGYRPADELNTGAASAAPVIATQPDED